MVNKIVSTLYVPLQPPYQVIKYDKDVAMQIGTLIITIQKESEDSTSDYQIETHSHPVVAYENKACDEMANSQLTNHNFLEGAVWNNVEVRDVTTICLTGATLTWQDFLDALEHENFITGYRKAPDVDIYWNLIKLGVKVLPPTERTCSVCLTLKVQIEECGISLQTDNNPFLYLNVSVAEDDFENDIENIYYKPEEGTWDSHEWKDEKKIWDELTQQLKDYRYVLRDLLFDKKDKHFTVKYETDSDKYKQLVERLNSVNNLVNLTFIS